MISTLRNRIQRPTGSVEYLVVGLGNPGREYEETRHNAGWLALDYIGKEENLSMKRLRFSSQCEDGVLAGKRVLFMKPMTYMNLSGQAVVEAMNFYKIPIENVIVLCDDTTLDVGKMRIRRNGSDGGQKGLRSIIQLSGSNNFPRIRIGIDKRPHPQMDLADWVLSKFTTKDKQALDKLYPDIYDAVKLIVSEDINQAMNKYN